MPQVASHWWIVVNPEGIDVCDADPGFDVRIVVRTRLRALTLVWRGDVTWDAAVRSGELELLGSPSACRALPGWLKLTPFASVPRPA